MATVPGWAGRRCDTSDDVRIPVFGHDVAFARQAANAMCRAVIAACEKAPARARKVYRAETYNCLAGDTLILTDEGALPIGELSGSNARLLTWSDRGPGRWTEAPVRSFGKQDVRRLVLSRYGREKVIRVTGDHRWFVRRGPRGVIERTTDELTSGDHLRSVFPRSVAVNTRPSSIGIAHGLTFGDGTLAEGAGVAVLAGPDRDLLRYFPEPSVTTWTTEGGVEMLRIAGLPKFFKTTIPPLAESAAYLYGWLAGYFAADGDVTAQGRVRLSSADEDVLLRVRDVATRLGIVTYPISAVKRLGYGPEPSMLYSLGFDGRSLDSSFFVKPAHRERFNTVRPVQPRRGWRVVSLEDDGRAEVFCATVPDTESFALEDFILTGNCRKTTGGTSWSAHSWPAAIDIDPERNPYSSSGRLITDMPPEFVSCFTDEGFGWGGNWSSVKDAMHYSVAINEGGKVTPQDFDPMWAQYAREAWNRLVTGSPTTPAGSAPPPPPKANGQPAPGWNPGWRAFRVRRGVRYMRGNNIRMWQQRMRDRGWTIAVDGVYGPKSQTVCTAFQREFRLVVDGIVGKATWHAAWERPVM